jgi:hypothetical protein
MSKMADSQPHVASENGQLEAEPKTRQGLSQFVKRQWDGIIDLSLANIPLLACCFITGLLDTTMFQGETARSGRGKTTYIMTNTRLTHKLPLFPLRSIRYLRLHANRKHNLPSPRRVQPEHQTLRLGPLPLLDRLLRPRRILLQPAAQVPRAAAHAARGPDRELPRPGLVPVRRRGAGRGRRRQPAPRGGRAHRLARDGAHRLAQLPGCRSDRC